VEAKTAFVLLQKLREVMGKVQHADQLSGKVEIDGAYFGGYVKPSTRKENRRDRRKLANQTGKRKCVTIMRERKGRSRPFICSEVEGAGMVPYVVDIANSQMFADEAKSYDSLEALVDLKRIDHSKSYAEGDINTNQAESFFSRLRRAERGVYHRIAVHLEGYANEMSWREDNRRRSNGEQFLNSRRLDSTAPCRVSGRATGSGGGLPRDGLISLPPNRSRAASGAGDRSRDDRRT
jgi:hypothetical protein